MTFRPQPLEAAACCRATGTNDSGAWMVELSASDLGELDAALIVAKSSGKRLTDITRAEFPLKTLAEKVANIETELLDGRGFALLKKLDTARYDSADLTLMFWGIGTHLGVPRPQNKYGEMIADVVDRGMNECNPDRRDDERGGIPLGYHTDGADFAGLLCLGKAASGGISGVANTIAIYNDLCARRPDLVGALHRPMPFDFRGEHQPGGRPFYVSPVFTKFHGRLFVRFLGEYIKTSQRHAQAPRLTPLALEAVDVLSQMAADPSYNVYMDLDPGDIQLINNNRVLHGRTAYVDAPELGLKRHMKRLWLDTERPLERPRQFRRGVLAHWDHSPVSRNVCS